MTRVLVVLSALALAAGCRTPESNPFAAIGPATIPPPTIEMPGSYYTTPPGAAAGAAAPLPANSLPSISVPSGGSAAPQPSIPRAPYSFGSLAPGSASAPSFAADSADREPIRIVEAAPSEARIATAPRSTPSVVEAAPAAREPIRAFNSGPAPKTYTPEPYKPAFGQPPASGFKSSGSFPIGSGVQPAAYQYAVPAFVESPSSGGGHWRAR
jgi:hypothetical protein